MKYSDLRQYHWGCHLVMIHALRIPQPCCYHRREVNSKDSNVLSRGDLTALPAMKTDYEIS